jgi:FtsP/CotA-like multicopper oxidase with cupredoxin domain
MTQIMKIFRPSRRLFLGQTLATLAFLPARTEPIADDPIRLEARRSALELTSGKPIKTATWAYNDATPGPLLRLKLGQELKVRLQNKLDQATTIHWHGVRNTNAMDGVGGLTQNPVAPGESFDYRFTPPDSGLYWYHPHVLGLNAGQIGRGLYGVLIVDEPEPPRTDRDMLLVIEDWKLDSSGQISDDFNNPIDAAGRGRIGDLVTLNSKSLPVSEELPPGCRLRLRILSAVTARIMFISFNGVEPQILAVDGQPCDDAFTPVQRTIPMGPGARFDIMFDLPNEAGKDVTLVLHSETEVDRQLLSLKTTGAAKTNPEMIASLPKNPLLPGEIKLQDAKKIDLLIETVKPKQAAAKDGKSGPFWSLNSVASESFSARPLFSVKRGTPVTLGFVNRTDFVQQMHVHGHHLRLLHDLDDGWEPYWRDAVLVPEHHTKHVAFIADNPGKWVIDSLILERTGLATWFEVT